MEAHDNWTCIWTECQNNYIFALNEFPIKATQLLINAQYVIWNKRSVKAGNFKTLASSNPMLLFIESINLITFKPYDDLEYSIVFNETWILILNEDDGNDGNDDDDINSQQIIDEWRVLSISISK